MKIKNYKSSNFNISDLVIFFEEINERFEPSLKERLIQKSDVNSFKDYAIKMSEKGEILIYVINEKIVGLLGFYANDVKKHQSFISILCVKPAYSNHGIGRSLVSECINYLNNNRFSTLRVNTWESNIVAQKLYINYGFQIESKKKGNIVFRLDLKNSLYEHITYIRRAKNLHD